MISGRLPTVREVALAIDVDAATVVEEETDNVGARHRSAYRLAAALPGAVIIVVGRRCAVRGSEERTRDVVPAYFKCSSVHLRDRSRGVVQAHSSARRLGHLVPVAPREMRDPLGDEPVVAPTYILVVVVHAAGVLDPLAVLNANQHDQAI